jgi:hypothetical protein
LNAFVLCSGFTRLPTSSSSSSNSTTKIISISYFLISKKLGS